MRPTPAAISRLIDYNHNENVYWGELLELDPSDQEAKAKVEHHHRSLMYWLREYKRLTGKPLGIVVPITVTATPTEEEILEESLESRAKLIAAQRKELTNTAIRLRANRETIRIALETALEQYSKNWLIEFALAQAGGASGVMMGINGRRLLKRAEASIQSGDTHMARQQIGLAKADYADAACALLDLGALINAFHNAQLVGGKKIELTILAGMTFGTGLAPTLAGANALQTGAAAMAQTGAFEATLLFAEGVDPAKADITPAQMKTALRKTIMAGGSAYLVSWASDLMSPAIADAVWSKRGSGGPTPSYFKQEVKKLVSSYCSSNIKKIRAAAEAVMEGKNPDFSLKSLLYAPLESFVLDRYTGLGGVKKTAETLKDIVEADIDVDG